MNNITLGNILVITESGWISLPIVSRAGFGSSGAEDT
jgi:hypothetical protein